MDHVLDLIPFDERVDPTLVGAIKVSVSRGRTAKVG
jgi:hypothetical protein